MPTPTKFTHVMVGAPTGGVLDLGDEYSQVHVSCTGPVRLQALLRTPGTAAPAAPLSDPKPAAGSNAPAGWVDLAANATDDFFADPAGQTKYRYVPYWEPAAGANLEVILEAR
jgi:hypothetical protein